MHKNKDGMQDKMKNELRIITIFWTYEEPGMQGDFESQGLIGSSIGNIMLPLNASIQLIYSKTISK